MAGPSFLAGDGKAAMAHRVSCKHDRYNEQDNQKEAQSSYPPCRQASDSPECQYSCQDSQNEDGNSP
jgi:hypothetical protein